ncbi:hypothetical protein PIB30_075083 [Stylosanthes scabra]|uniref:Uncharacterized protein n=1 Tax=Stylosanthes scabra TaxID=79078 RepID=A0ABU6XPU6_9FABA|nr:hypothetical protein [Stylosanthes scabra]
MGWGFSLHIFQAFQVQVRAWKVGVYGLVSPKIESSVALSEKLVKFVQSDGRPAAALATGSGFLDFQNK